MELTSPMEYGGVTLDPFQEQAIRAIDAGASVLVSAPTGAGKTLIAEYAVDKALREGRRILYTAPIKALSNQKFRDFTERYGNRVGIKTGDVTLNPEAPAIIMTTEIFRNTIFESPRDLEGVSHVVFDEIHYLDDIERGTVWEESLIFAPPHIRFVCLSATIPNLDVFADWMRSVREGPLETVVETERPVPLKHVLWVPGKGVVTLKDLHRWEAREGRSRRPPPRAFQREQRRQLFDHLVAEKRLPVLYFAFNRRACEELAEQNRNRHLLDPEDRDAILADFDALAGRYDLRIDDRVQSMRRLAAVGVACHHAGLLPTLKEIVERLFSSGRIKLLFATETFAVGINMPARTVVFDTIHKFDGVRRNLLRTREHQQMAGRAGRRGMDAVGHVYSQIDWPLVRANGVERVIHGRIEPIESQFSLSYATLLNLHRRLGDRLLQACEKSFANFHNAKDAEGGGGRGDAAARRGSRPDAGRGRGSSPFVSRPRDGDARPDRDPRFGPKIRQVRQRLQFLRERGYLKGKDLTPRGEFASQVYGYEIQMAELKERRMFDGLTPDRLNVMVNAVVFESKKADWYRPPDRGTTDPFRRPVERLIGEIRDHEERLDIDLLTKEPDFRLAAAVHAWSAGAPFEELERHTSASPGDLVRTFRLTIQLLRQTAKAFDRRDPDADLFHDAMRRICRGVVDAERQLRLAVTAPEAWPIESPGEIDPPVVDPADPADLPGAPAGEEPPAPAADDAGDDDAPLA